MDPAGPELSWLVGNETQGRGQGKHPWSRREVGRRVGTRKRTEHFHSAEGRALDGLSCPRARGAAWRGGEGPGPETCRWGPEDPLKAGRIPVSIGRTPGGMSVRVPPARSSTKKTGQLRLQRAGKYVRLCWSYCHGSNCSVLLL